MKSVRSLLNPYRTVLWQYRYLPRRSLRRLRNFLGLLCIASGLVTTLAIITEAIPPLPWLGVTLIFFGLWLEQFIVYAYNNSRYFHGLDSVTGSSDKQSPGLQYLSAVTLAENSEDCVAGFFHSRFGKDVINRLGLTSEAVEEFLTSSRPRFTHDNFAFDSTQPISLTDVARRLYEEDASLRAWLLTQVINFDTWQQAVALVEKIHTDSMRAERWWSRDNLSRCQSLGRELSFGHHSFINSVSRPFTLNTVVQNSHPIYDQYVNEIANALAKDKVSNILLLGTEGGGVIDILARLQYQFSSGQQLRSLHHPHLYEIDMDLFFGRFSTPELFINNFERLLSEAASAGNIILIFTHFSALINRARSMGLDIITMIDDYLISPSLHVIAVDTPTAYHTYLRQQTDLTRHFTEVTLDNTDLATLRNIVTDYIISQEDIHRVVMTVGAIDALIIDAERYLTEGDMPDRAITLADSILNHAGRHQITQISADEVHQFVRNLTNVPIGPISEAEGDLLVHLENHLSQYVAGQPAAVSAVARTMRRARADIERHNKPIGSFLFLGPTGVGKTETAKTLARVFFQNEEAMTRFDMSEYSHNDALTWLIGNPDTVGKLTASLTAQPYTVFLLDEFEKAHQSIHDLFLQILDEGFFTTGAGEKINARTTIIIATSNAGSDLIARTIASRQATPHLTEKIINSLTSSGIFRPELINRFDNTIVFEPLNDDAKRQVTIKFLNQLVDRVAKQGYTISYDESIVEIILEQGFDPAYGARPLQRFIQNLLEDYLAKAILEKTIIPGRLFILTKSLFSEQDISTASLN